MNTKIDNSIEVLESPGDRLNHLLDQIGFRQGRGRVTDLQSYLAEKSPDLFSDLKYTTVRSWFQEHAPPMVKVDAIIQALQKEYTFHHDISQIKAWWKIGGFYPFTDQSAGPKPDIDELKRDFEKHEEKLQYIIMALVAEETGECFHSLSIEDLLRLKEKAVLLAREYADPFKMECPSKYLRLVIKDEFRIMQHDKSEQ